MPVRDPSGQAGLLTVFDGDSFRLPDGRRVRLPAVDTPEAGRPLAEEATRRAAALLEGRRLALEPPDPPRDRYGRLLADLAADGRSLSAALVEEGLAWCYGGADPALGDLQRRAVRQGRGVHGLAAVRSLGLLVVGGRSFHDAGCPVVRRRIRSLPVARGTAALFTAGLAPCRTCLPWPPAWPPRLPGG